MEMIERARKQAKETRREVLLQTMTLINAAFALVAALAWNEAVKALIERYFKAGSGLYSRFIYAIAITVFVVLIGRYINSLTKKFEQNAEAKATDEK